MAIAEVAEVLWEEGLMELTGLKFGRSLVSLLRVVLVEWAKV